MLATVTTIMPSGEAIAFVGVGLQALALIWIWRDWKLSQYQTADWKRDHRKSETDTLDAIAGLWSKFGGKGDAANVDWENIGIGAIEDMAKMFPASFDDDDLKKRKVQFIGERFGVGPSNADLTSIRGHLDHLTLLRRGVADYRTFTRKNTFKTALYMMLLGYCLQVFGSWPSKWYIQVEQSNQTDTQGSRAPSSIATAAPTSADGGGATLNPPASP